MKLLVVGGGGREHAIIKSLKKNQNVTEIFALPGNGGMEKDATCVDIGAKEYIHQLIWDLAAKENKAVILISSDMNEIVSLARRMLIFKGAIAMVP